MRPEPEPMVSNGSAHRRKYWWIVVAIPAIALVVRICCARRLVPYSAEVRATVILPGDTEDPGNSERPELMILDDLPVTRWFEVFAERVQSGWSQTDLTVGRSAGIA